MRSLSLAAAAARALTMDVEVSITPEGQRLLAELEPKPLPPEFITSATPRAPLKKAARRAKAKAAQKARTAQRMRAKGKR